MSETTLRWLTIGSGSGAALVGGVLFAFSTFIMKALDSLPAPEGIAAMQAINRAAPNPLFMAALFGTLLAFIALAVVTVRQDGSATLPVVACLLYAVTIILTVAYHVPRNDALAAIDAHAAGSADFWRDYVGSWTAWNSVRAATALAAAVTVLASLRSGGGTSGS